MTANRQQGHGLGGLTSSFTLSLGQLTDGKILLVLLKSAALAFLGLVLLLSFLGQIWPDANLLDGWWAFFGLDGTNPTLTADMAGSSVGSDGAAFSADPADQETEAGWFDGFMSGLGTFFYWVLVLAAFYFLFPVLLTLIISLFLDDIMDAVEAKHYPDRRATRKVGLVEGIKSGLALSVKLLMAHMLLLIPYLILFVLGLGLVAVLLFTMVNAWAYSREYFDMVAGRHFSRKGTRMMYADEKGDIFPIGLVIAGLFLLPVVNILAPILGVAMMTHHLHRVMADA